MYNKPYRFRTLLWDIFMIGATAGCWIFWIPIREIIRGKNRNNTGSFAINNDQRKIIL